MFCSWCDLFASCGALVACAALVLVLMAFNGSGCADGAPVFAIRQNVPLMALKSKEAYRNTPNKPKTQHRAFYKALKVRRLSNSHRLFIFFYVVLVYMPKLDYFIF